MTQNSVNNSASEFTVDNLFLDGNTLSSTDTNGNINISPDGTGDVTIVSGDLSIEAGALVVDPGAATDSYIQYNESTAARWRTGNDATDDSYRISQGNALGTNDTIVVSSAGEITMPLQSAFMAYKSSSSANATGNNVLVSPIVFDTEQYDQNSDYNSGTGVFTAPVTGRYFFESSIQWSNLGAGHVSSEFNLVRVGINTYYGGIGNPGAGRSGGNFQTAENCSYIPLTLGDTVISQTVVGPSTQTVGIDGSAIVTSFGGKLVC